MKILAIDTSCDDTSLAILEIKNSKFKILSNIVSSQVKVHRKYGGVYPILAKREHQRNLVPVLKESLLKSRLLKSKIKNQKSKTQIKNKKLKKILKQEEVFYKKLEKFLEKYQKPKIDVLAVTIGPGLDPCLWQGVNFARALGYVWNLPIIPVNHIEGHILANLLPQIRSKSKIKNQKSKIKFPAICLIVSGGHTQLVLMTPVRKASLSNGARRNWKYKIIGETRDDAAGECFDKTARILGLPYPGGPSITQQAAQLKLKVKKGTSRFAPCNCKAIKEKLKIFLPRPMLKSKDYDFSFSGLKTAVLYDFKKRPKKIRVSKEYIKEMAKEIQQAIIDVLIKKTIRAAKNYQVKTIMLGGGVASNKELRKQFKEKIKRDAPRSKLLIPNPEFCTDNAAMIAVAGYFNKKKSWRKIKAEPNLRI